MVTLDRVPAVMLVLLVVAVVAVATFLTLDELNEQQVDGSINCNAVNRTGCGAGFNSTLQMETGIANIFDLAPTWGTLIGVSVLLIIVAGLAVIGMIGFGKARDKGFL